MIVLWRAVKDLWYNRDVMHKKQALLSAMDGGQRSVCDIMKFSF